MMSDTVPNSATGNAPDNAVNGKNIVICYDGTGDWATFDKTNVMKLYEALDKSDPSKQVVFYNGGVGTLGSQLAISKLKKSYLRLLDLATATSLREQILMGYEFVLENYQKGDRIYIFGFSRGAYTARLLASFIYNFRLLKHDCRHLAPYLWQSISSIPNMDRFKDDRTIIRQEFSEPEAVEIEFLGLFDTVSSVGIFDRFRVFPHTDRNESVKHVRHAVSIHESRNAFPELLVKPALDSTMNPINDVVEIWFEGVHRDIGGGAPDNRGYENMTYNWVVGEAEHLSFVTSPPCAIEQTKIHAGGFDVYVIAGLYPMKMFDYSLIDRTAMNRSFTQAIKKSKGRPIKDLGFRWYWPNFKHFRDTRIPGNAFEYRGYGPVPDSKTNEQDHLVFDHSDGKTKRIANAQAFRDPTPPADSGPIGLVPDVVGITLGCALAFLVGNRGLGSPFGESWPSPAAPVALFFFLFYLIEQGHSHKFHFNPKLKWLEMVVPVVGAFLVWRLFASVDSWPTLFIALGFGAGIALISLAPVRLPVLRADRAVPLFMLPWAATSFGLWAVPEIFAHLKPSAQLVGHWFSPGISWLSHQNISTKFTDEMIQLGFFKWNVVIHLDMNYQACAWVIAMLAGVSGVLQIIQDRIKMRVK